MKVNERAIDRLDEFCKWCIDQKLVKSRSDFEVKCGMGRAYLRNSLAASNKGNIGADVMASVKRTFPMLSLDWLVLGDGNMLTAMPSGGYIARYEKLEQAFSDIELIIKRLK